MQTFLDKNEIGKEIEKWVERKRLGSDGGDAVVCGFHSCLYRSRSCRATSGKCLLAKDAPPLFFLRGLTVCNNPRVLVGTQRLLSRTVSLTFHGVLQTHGAGRQMAVGRQMAAKECGRGGSEEDSNVLIAVLPEIK